jgi:hypothetical protein
MDGKTLVMEKIRELDNQGKGTAAKFFDVRPQKIGFWRKGINVPLEAVDRVLATFTVGPDNPPTPEAEEVDDIPALAEQMVESSGLAEKFAAADAAGVPIYQEISEPPTAPPLSGQAPVNIPAMTPPVGVRLGTGAPYQVPPRTGNERVAGIQKVETPNNANAMLTFIQMMQDPQKKAMWDMFLQLMNLPGGGELRNSGVGRHAVPPSGTPQMVQLPQGNVAPETAGVFGDSNWNVPHDEIKAQREASREAAQKRLIKKTE